MAEQGLSRNTISILAQFNFELLAVIKVLECFISLLSPIFASAGSMACRCKPAAASHVSQLAKPMPVRFTAPYFWVLFAEVEGRGLVFSTLRKEKRKIVARKLNYTRTREIGRIVAALLFGCLQLRSLS